MCIEVTTSITWFADNRCKTSRETGNHASISYTLTEHRRNGTFEGRYKNVISYYQKVKSVVLEEIENLSTKSDAVSRGDKALLHHFLN